MSERVLPTDGYVNDNKSEYRVNFIDFKDEA